MLNALQNVSIDLIQNASGLHGLFGTTSMFFLRQLRAFLIRSWLRWIAPRWTVGCLAVLRDVDGRVCLLKHKGRVKPWGLPGGLVAWPETPEQGLRRELSEELSWNTESNGRGSLNLRLIKSCVSEKFPMIELIFEASGRISDEVIRLWIPQASEVAEIGWFSRSDLENLEGILERHRSLLLGVLRSP